MVKIYSVKFVNKYLHFVHAVCMCGNYDHLNKAHL
jgi:hypothetical protein